MKKILVVTLLLAGSTELTYTKNFYNTFRDYWIKPTEEELEKNAEEKTAAYKDNRNILRPSSYDDVHEDNHLNYGPEFFKEREIYPHVRQAEIRKDMRIAAKSYQQGKRIGTYLGQTEGENIGIRKGFNKGVKGGLILGSAALVGAVGGYYAIKGAYNRWFRKEAQHIKNQFSDIEKALKKIENAADRGILKTTNDLEKKALNKDKMLAEFMNNIITIYTTQGTISKSQMEKLIQKLT